MNEVDEHFSGKGAHEVTRLRIAEIACALAIAIPWISPFSGGPSAQVIPWLISLFCALVFCAAGGMRRLPLSLLVACSLFLVWGAARGHGGLDFFALAGGIGLVMLSASAGASFASSENGLRSVAWAFLTAAAINALIGVAQHQGLLPDGSLWLSGGTPGEAEGNLRQRNLFASHLSLGMIALAWLFARGLRMTLAIPFVVLLSVASAASTSRTGLLQLLLLAAFAMVLPGPRRGQRVALGIVGLAAYVLATFGLPWLLELRGIDAGTLFERTSKVPLCSSRRTLWANVLTLVAQRPFLGWGWGELDYAHYMVLFDGPRFCDILDNAHNLPLHLAVELGIPAAVMVMLCVAWATWRARPWREINGDRRFAWAILAVLALHSLVEYPLWYGPFQTAAGIALGILCAGRMPEVRRTASWTWTAAIMVLASYASWDFWRVGQIYLPPEARSPAYAHNTIARVGQSWIYRDQVRFAALTLATLTPENAQQMNILAGEMLHFSPEPRVIERVIESAKLLGQEDEVAQEARRYRAAFPREYARWDQQQGALAPAQSAR